MSAFRSLPTLVPSRNQCCRFTHRPIRILSRSSTAAIVSDATVPQRSRKRDRETERTSSHWMKLGCRTPGRDGCRPVRGLGWGRGSRTRLRHRRAWGGLFLLQPVLDRMIPDLPLSLLLAPRGSQCRLCRPPQRSGGLKEGIDSYRQGLALFVGEFPQNGQDVFIAFKTAELCFQ